MYAYSSIIWAHSLLLAQVSTARMLAGARGCTLVAATNAKALQTSSTLTITLCVFVVCVYGGNVFQRDALYDQRRVLTHQIQGVLCKDSVAPVP